MRKRQNTSHEITLRRSRHGLTFRLGLGLGVGAMYYFDPDAGARRRHVLRGKLAHLGRVSRRLFEKAMRDVGNRSGGFVSRILNVFDRGPVSDPVLVARVRASMGRKVSRPHSISVDARDGVVRLLGPIPGDEYAPLIRCVRNVRGVRDVIDRLEVRDEPNAPRSIARTPASERPWSPVMRVFGSGFGCALAIGGLRRGGVVGGMMTILGASLLLRGSTDMPAKRLVGMGAGRRSIDLHKTITVHAPVDEVYRFWTRLENFPRFMEHVKEIRKIDDELSHWRVAGPGGISVEWDAVITKRQPNKVFAWKTVPTSTIWHAGIIRFEPVDGTRLDIRMAYNPPAGVLGHLVASMFRKDPKHAMDDDLVRMKSLLEDGKSRAHGQQVTLADLH